MNENWQLIKVPAGKWVRANRLDQVTTEARMHIVPVSQAACIFTATDTRGRNNFHMTQTGFNPSWIQMGAVWIQAYRVFPDKVSDDYRWAISMIDELERQLAESQKNGFPKHEYIENIFN
jgi:hypothetical protein